ncbi:MAG: formate-dependent phosphoribosylglycinamide formyltransferase [Cyanobacteria bacterium P01_E01_bin.45]
MSSSATNSTRYGTPHQAGARKVMLLGSGELGKEVVIELQRLGVETIAVDRYPNAPAHAVAHRSYVANMLDAMELTAVIAKEQPDLVVPEVEAISTKTLEELEVNGQGVIPTARAVQLTMNRRGIRQLAGEELELPTSPYRFARSLPELQAAAEEVGFPCVIKPIMSSSGKGQSVAKIPEQLEKSWDYACSGGRGSKSAAPPEVIVEGFVDFDYEITLLTVRACNGTFFCPPIGHRQEAGDYRESWQPCAMSELALQKSQDIAQRITEALGGYGIFGVELFIKGDAVWFSEVSPRPHDTGLVTLGSQNLSEFALHARALLGLPIPEIRLLTPAASAVVLADAAGDSIHFDNLNAALAVPESQLLLFGKPKAYPNRRLGVVVAAGESVEEARDRASTAAAAIRLEIS